MARNGFVLNNKFFSVNHFACCIWKLVTPQLSASPLGRNKRSNHENLMYALLFSLVIVLSCKEKSSTTKPTNDFPELSQSWMNPLRKKLILSIFIVRVVTNNIPLRDIETLSPCKAMEKCSYLVLSPTDAHYFVAGTWSVNVSSDTIVELRDTVGGIHYKLKVVELKNDLLRVLKLK